MTDRLFKEFIDLLLDCKNQSLTENETDEKLASFWIERRDLSSAPLKFLSNKLKTYQDYLLASPKILDNSPTKIAVVDYKGTALKWIVEKRIALGENKFDVYNEDLKYRFDATRILDDYFSIDYPFIKDIINGIVNNYNVSIRKGREEIIVLFNKKIKEEVATIKAAKNKTIVSEKLVKLHAQLVEKIQNDNFEYAPKLKEEYIEIISYVNEEIIQVEDQKTVVKKDDLTISQKLIILDYLNYNQLFLGKNFTATEKVKHELIGLLIGSTYESVRDGFSKIYSTIRQPQPKQAPITPASAEHKIKDLEKIRPILEKIGDKVILAKLEEDIKRLENKIK